MVSSGVSVALCDPEIPANTGNIARTCVATDSPLYLVGSLGYSLKDRHLRRAGLDYFQDLRMTWVPDLGWLRSRFSRSRLVVTSARGGTSHTQFAFCQGDILVFGSESRGLAPVVTGADPDLAVRIVTTAAVRSLNLSNAVAVILFEALRQTESLQVPQVGGGEN